MAAAAEGATAAEALSEAEGAAACAGARTFTAALMTAGFESMGVTVGAEREIPPGRAGFIEGVVVGAARTPTARTGAAGAAAARNWAKAGAVPAKR